jgi:hypothetical protein
LTNSSRILRILRPIVVKHARKTTKVREGRERMAMKTFTNIKKVEEECAKIYEESTQIWIDLVEDPEMKVVEAKLREAQEKAQKYSRGSLHFHQLNV